MNVLFEVKIWVTHNARLTMAQRPGHANQTQETLTFMPRKASSTMHLTAKKRKSHENRGVCGQEPYNGGPTNRGTLPSRATLTRKKQAAKIGLLQLVIFNQSCGYARRSRKTPN